MGSALEDYLRSKVGNSAPDAYAGRLQAAKDRVNGYANPAVLWAMKNVPGTTTVAGALAGPERARRASSQGQQPASQAQAAEPDLDAESAADVAEYDRTHGSPATRQGLGGTTPTQASFAPKAQAPEPHKMSPDELMAYAKQMLDHQEVANSASMAAGPSVHDNSPGTPQNGYNSQERGGFQEWKKKNAPNDSGEDYDLKGAYAAGESPGPNGHWSDEFKKPNHETFSNESKYADFEPGKAGSWDGDNYRKPGSVTPEWLKNYMGDQE